MRPRFQADADFNHKIVLAPRRKEPAIDIRSAYEVPSPGVVIVAQDLDIGAAVEEILLIWAASDAEEWRDQLAFIPI